jgi:hypothetical protein
VCNQIKKDGKYKINTVQRNMMKWCGQVRRMVKHMKKEREGICRNGRG